MPRGGFGRGFGGGFGGRGFGMRRMGMPLLYPMGGGGMGSPLLTTLMAGGLGYMMGSNSAQQAVPPSPAYPSPYPYQGSPATPGPAVSTDNGKLAQFQLLGKLHNSGILTDDEFEREKQQLLYS
jgi:putative oligomerization/nucleic acid binding protein